LIHKFKAASSQMTANMHLASSSLASNSSSGTTSASLDVWAANISKMTATEPAPQYSHISTNSTNVIKIGPGTLQRVTINSPGGTNNTATIYDNTSGSGTVIGVINTTSGASSSTLMYNCQFSVGLTVVVASGSAADLTVIYD